MVDNPATLVVSVVISTWSVNSTFNIMRVKLDNACKVSAYEV